MSGSTPEGTDTPQYGTPPPPAFDTPAATTPAAPMAPMAPMGGLPSGPVGKVRSTGTCIVLMIVTLGIYSLFWYGGVHSDMKKHTGAGIGGALAVVLALFVSIVSPFLTSAEVGGLYARRGQDRPVSALTGLWCLLPLLGLIIWFVKTNGALNDYWRSLGAH
jgi:hypothetical protein